MKDEDSNLFVINFSVANIYPRIQELAVLACNLLFDASDKMQSERNLQVLLKKYQKNIPLTDRELRSLPTFINLAHAMHLLNANYEKVTNDIVPPENEYWLIQGRLGLEQRYGLSPSYNK
jgi:Ser/Thr protein kinase RdoA (MazF antagonist)